MADSLELHENYKVIKLQDVSSFLLDHVHIPSEEDILTLLETEWGEPYEMEGENGEILGLVIANKLVIPDNMTEFLRNKGACEIHITTDIHISFYHPEKYTSFYKEAVCANCHHHKLHFSSKYMNGFYVNINEDKDDYRQNFTNLYYIGEVHDTHSRGNTYILMDLNPESNQYGYLFIWNNKSGMFYPFGTKEYEEYPAFICKTITEFVQILNEREFWKLSSMVGVYYPEDNWFDLITYFRNETGIIAPSYGNNICAPSFCGPWYADCSSDVKKYIRKSEMDGTNSQTAFYTRFICENHKSSFFYYFTDIIEADTMTKSADKK